MGCPPSAGRTQARSRRPDRRGQGEVAADGPFVHQRPVDDDTLDVWGIDIQATAIASAGLSAVLAVALGGVGHGRRSRYALVPTIRWAMAVGPRVKRQRCAAGGVVPSAWFGFRTGESYC